jgi:hypothetical protein
VVYVCVCVCFILLQLGDSDSLVNGFHMLQLVYPFKKGGSGGRKYSNVVIEGK